MFQRTQQKWKTISLAQQFTVAASAILLPVMLAVGVWLADILTISLVNTTSNTMAIFMDGVVHPHIKEIIETGELSSNSVDNIDQLLSGARSNSKIVAMKIWRRDNTIIYSSFRDMIGKNFERSPALQTALSGKIAHELDGPPEEEEIHERASGLRLLAVYAPVYQPGTANVIAVSEFYVNGEELSENISLIRWQSWFLVCALTGCIVLLLSSFVARGSRTIERQQKLLGYKVQELGETLTQNESLRHKLLEANQNVASVNEKVLQQVGTDLHDGPAQILALVALKLTNFKALLTGNKKLEGEFISTKRLLSDALKDVRNLSTGLMLPELEELSLAEAIALAISNHKRNTGTLVIEELDTHHPEVPVAFKICAYRLVQESLNNAYKHAAGAGQKVILHHDEVSTIKVYNSGPGFDLKKSRDRRLGLAGMFARVEALGGILKIENPAGGGTIVHATLPPDKN